MSKVPTLTQRRQHAKYERLIEVAKTKPPLPTAVAHPCDETSLSGAIEAYRAQLIVPILVGPADKIRKLAKTSRPRHRPPRDRRRVRTATAPPRRPSLSCARARPSCS